jgi:hypothetical protein
MSPRSKSEYTEVVHIRYKNATRQEKTAILDEYCATVKCHRKHAIRVLKKFKRFTKPKAKRRGKPPIYQREAIRTPLKEIWITATQFGRAMSTLGIEMIPTYSPEARGRSERAFSTHQGRLPKELVAQGITELDDANRYLDQVYRIEFKKEFMQPAPEGGAVFVPWAGSTIDDILCEKYERAVTSDRPLFF